VRRYYDKSDQAWCRHFINSLSYYEVGCGDDCCQVWNSKGKSAVKYNVFKKKYRERQEPETLSFWGIAFISEHGYLDVGNDRVLMCVLENVFAASTSFKKCIRST